MGFRSTFVSEDLAIKWPDWFYTKYSNSINFGNNFTGAISSKFEGKTDETWKDLPEDIQKALIETNEPAPFEFVYLHECGGVTKVGINKNMIIYMEPEQWEQTKGVTHRYCYSCSEPEMIIL